MWREVVGIAKGGSGLEPSVVAEDGETFGRLVSSKAASIAMFVTASPKALGSWISIGR